MLSGQVETNPGPRSPVPIGHRFSVMWSVGTGPRSPVPIALHEPDFFLYFSSENSIVSCVTVGLQHICST